MMRKISMIEMIVAWTAAWISKHKTASYPVERFCLAGHNLIHFLWLEIGFSQDFETTRLIFLTEMHIQNIIIFVEWSLSTCIR